MLGDYVGVDYSVCAGVILFGGERLGQVEYDRDCGDRTVLGDGKEGCSRPGLHVGRIDYGEFSAAQAFFEDQVQEFEGVFGGVLVGFVVGYKGSAVVGREDLGGAEVAGGEGGFAGSGGADE